MAKRKGNLSVKYTLTDRQREVYECIRRSIKNYGYGPTVREIGDSVGINSPNGVVGHLKALVKKGLILRQPHLSRSIQLVNNQEANTCKATGSISGGVFKENETPDNTDLSFLIPIEGVNQFISVKDNTFADYKIVAGDTIIIRNSVEAKKNQSVLYTLKNKLYLAKWSQDLTKKFVKLQNLEEGYVPNSLDYPEVIGVLVGVVRNCL